jgi:hypothetical protein
MIKFRNIWLELPFICYTNQTTGIRDRNRRDIYIYSIFNLFHCFSENNPNLYHIYGERKSKEIIDL